jgi:hypothetical protein
MLSLVDRPNARMVLRIYMNQEVSEETTSCSTIKEPAI